MKVALLAVDEAHCISEWGHEFRPAYRELQAIRAPLGSPPVVALTATATPAVRDDIIRVCGLASPIRVVAGFDRANLVYAVRRVPGASERDRQVYDRVVAARGPAVVYAASRARVERLSSMLARAGIRASPYHAGQPPAWRRATQDRFMNGGAAVIVATSAFGMGVDKADVRLVIHDAMPGSLESYYQEAGRAGRDGARSECVLLYARNDRRSPEHFIRSAAPVRSVIEGVYAAAMRVGANGARVDAATVASLAKVPLSEVRGALAILARAGAMREARGDIAAIWIRLVATAHRIHDACPAGSFERDLLRSLAQAAGRAIASGTTISLASLPPGLGEVGLASALDALARQSMLVWRRPGSGIFLADPALPPDRLRVDWASVAAHRRAADARLAAMIGYAETRRCRRERLLAYFGDSLGGRVCSGCDRCGP